MDSARMLTLAFEKAPANAARFAPTARTGTKTPLQEAFESIPGRGHPKVEGWA